MKKLAVLALSAAALALCACNEQKDEPMNAEKAGKAIDKAAVDTGKAADKAAADAEKKADGLLSGISHKVKSAEKEHSGDLEKALK